MNALFAKQYSADAYFLQDIGMGLSKFIEGVIPL